MRDMSGPRDFVRSKNGRKSSGERLPEVKPIAATDYSSAISGTAAVTPRTVTANDLNQDKYLADLIILKDVQITTAEVPSSDGTKVYTNYYADGIRLFDKSNLDLLTEQLDGKTATITAIFGAREFGDYEREIFPISIEAEGMGAATAINGIESSNNNVIYTLQGVRVEKAQKGVYIMNGKKVVVK